MFGSGIKLFSILGFEVKLDFSWIFIAALVVWSLATGYFPRQVEGLATDTYWTMAVVAMLGLFLSVILHELAHSLVARLYGLKINGITLFIFGGMAEMANEPENPTTEFMMAIAGPLGSFVIAGAFYLIMLLGGAVGAGSAIVAVFSYLAFINIVLAVFNLIPAFPMDGGRVLRAVLWHYLNDMSRATRIAARGGHFFGIGLIVLGVLAVIQGNFVSGIWMVLIGLFIQRAAASANFRSDVSSVFGNQLVRQFMLTTPISIEADVNVQTLVNEFFYQYYHDMFPVTDNGKLVGCVTVRDVQKISRNEWKATDVRTIMTPSNTNNTINDELVMTDVLKLMGQANNGRLMVVRETRLVGIVTLKDLLGIITLKSQLDPSG